MKTPDEIRCMIERLNENIFDHNWDPQIEGAIIALTWAVGDPPYADTSCVEQLMEATQEKRRQMWIAAGGNPAEWPN